MEPELQYQFAVKALADDVLKITTKIIEKIKEKIKAKIQKKFEVVVLNRYNKALKDVYSKSIEKTEDVLNSFFEKKALGNKNISSKELKNIGTDVRKLIKKHLSEEIKKFIDEIR